VFHPLGSEVAYPADSFKNYRVKTGNDPGPDPTRRDYSTANGGKIHLYLGLRQGETSPVFSWLSIRPSARTSIRPCQPPIAISRFAIRFGPEKGWFDDGNLRKAFRDGSFPADFEA
jgi:hypothetical protein